MVVQSVTAHRKEFPVTIETGRENVFPNIEVKEDINQLEEVVVTGQFSPQSMKNSLYKVRSVNSDQIRQKAPWMYSRCSTPKSASASRTTWRSEKRTSS